MKFNSMLLAASAVCFFATACSKNSSTQPTNPPAPVTQYEGGVNGGGGGTLPADPISTYNVHEIIRDAKRTLDPLIRMNLALFDAKLRSPAEKKVYGASPNLLDALYDTNIEILDDKACHDSAGNDVDGSMYATDPNAICISAYRIAPKLIKERAPIEILALIAHELSHRLGTDESEAVEIQKSVASDLSENVFGVAPSSDSFLNGLKDKLSRVIDALDKIKTKTMSDAEISQLVHQASLAEGEAATADLPFSLMSPLELEYSRFISAQLMVLEWSITPAERPDADKYFHGQTALSFGEFKARFPGSREQGPFDSEKIVLPLTRAEVETVLGKILEFYWNLAERPNVLLYGSRPNPIILPTPEMNRFAPFIGRYTVSSVKCDAKSEAEEIQFEIKSAPYDSGRLHLFSRSPGWGGDEGGLYDGADVTAAASYVSTDSGPGWASRSQENGNRWGSRQAGGNLSKRTYKFVNVNGVYKLIRTDERQTETYGPDGFASVKIECIYQLQKN